MWMPDSFKKQLIINTAIIIGSILVFGAAFYFLSGMISKEADDLVADRELIRHHERAADELAFLKQSQADAQKYGDKLQKLLPIRDQLLGFSDYLDSVARIYKININASFTAAPVEPSGGQSGYLAFTLGIDGPYEDIRNFLNDIEAKGTSFIVAFDNFDVNRNGESYYASINGRTFFK